MAAGIVSLALVCTHMRVHTHVHRFLTPPEPPSFTFLPETHFADYCLVVRREGMSREEAEGLVSMAVALAMSRDG